MKIKVTNQNIDEDLFIKSEKIKINHKTIHTPIKSFNMSNLRRDTEINNNVKGVNEIFKILRIDKIKEFVSGEVDIIKFSKNIDTDIKKTGKDEINFCFINLPDDKLPEGKEIDLVTNLTYVKSDAVPLPLVNAFFKMNMDGDKSFDKYTNFMEKCIDSINRLNNKAIVGVIPSRMNHTYIEDLLDFYHSNNITSFVFDFDGRQYTGFDIVIREFMIALNALDISKESFTYSCNVSPGRVTAGTNIVQARDILVYNYGFDMMGDNHKPFTIPPDVAESLKKRANNSFIRLFNSEDYGHYKHDSFNNARAMYPVNETKIPFEVFRKDNTKSNKCQKLFNSERIGLELLKYQNIINKNESTLEYLKTKEQITNTLDGFKQFKNNLNV